MYGYGYSYPNNPQGSGLMGRYEAGVRSDGGSFAFPIDTGLASRLEGLGLLNASSLVNSCNAGKESVLYNLIPTPVQSLDRFAVTRSTVKWVLGQDGVLTSIPANTPAFEYNTDGTYRGLLVEPAGTNIVLQSEDFSTTWASQTTGTGVTPAITTNAEIAPNGTQTADLIVFNRGAGNAIGDRSGLSQSPTVVNATVYTNSVWLKAATAGDVGKQLAVRGVAGGAFLVITLTSSWVRYTRTETSVSTTGFFEITNRGTITADNTVSAFVWGAQLETGSVATSYIPTVASTQTRTADSVTLTGASSLIGQTEGTLYVEAILRVTASASGKGLIEIRQDGNNRFRILHAATTDAIQAIGTTASATQFSISTASTQSGTFKTALAYNTDDVAFYVNGAQVGTDNTSITPATSLIGIGCTADGLNPLNGWIRSAVLFTTRLPNATLVALTA